MKLLYLVESGKSKFLVFDEMPDKISTKYGDDTIIGRIGGVFYDFLAKRNERREAFGGRKFDIVLDNGEIEKCEGQWWDAVTDRAREELEKEGNPLYAFKVATAYFREQGKVPVFEDSNCRLIKL